jgi:hypothetical protein
LDPTVVRHHEGRVLGLSLVGGQNLQATIGSDGSVRRELRTPWYKSPALTS